MQNEKVKLSFCTFQFSFCILRLDRPRLQTLVRGDDEHRLAIDFNRGQALQLPAGVELVQRRAVGQDDVDRAVRPGQNPLAGLLPGELAGDDRLDGFLMNARRKRVLP